jgi:hypothetical protein
MTLKHAVSKEITATIAGALSLSLSLSLPHTHTQLANLKVWEYYCIHKLCGSRRLGMYTIIWWKSWDNFMFSGGFETELVQSCSGSGNCPRYSCWPLLGESFQCVDVTKNKYCTSQSGNGSCTQLRADYSKSYIRYYLKEEFLKLSSSR